MRIDQTLPNPQLQRAPLAPRLESSANMAQDFDLFMQFVQFRTMVQQHTGPVMALPKEEPAAALPMHGRRAARAHMPPVSPQTPPAQVLGTRLTRVPLAAVGLDSSQESDTGPAHLTLAISPSSATMLTQSTPGLNSSMDYLTSLLSSPSGI